MKAVYINGKFLSTRLTGVQRVGRELSSRLAKALEKRGVCCTILEPPAWMAASRRRALWTLLWEQIVLPLRAFDGLLVNLCNSAPLAIQRNQIVVMHDAAVFDMPENYSVIYGRWARLQMRLLTRGSNLLVTVSQFSRARLAKALGRPEKDFWLMREGCNHAFATKRLDSVLDRLDLRGRRYVLAVGSLQPGKNFRNLLQAMNEVDNDIVLVIAGGGDSIVFSSGIVLSSDRYVQAGYVSDGELRSLYTHALCFVQASTYEGFGLPVVEAMALGTPVACSIKASLPEVCGDAASYFNPLEPDDIAHAINTIAGDLKLRERLVRSGYARSRYFDWDVGAEEFAQFLLNVLK